MRKLEDSGWQAGGKASQRVMGTWGVPCSVNALMGHGNVLPFDRDKYALKTRRLSFMTGGGMVKDEAMPLRAR